MLLLKSTNPHTPCKNRGGFIVGKIEENSWSPRSRFHVFSLAARNRDTPRNILRTLYADFFFFSFGLFFFISNEFYRIISATISVI